MAKKLMLIILAAFAFAFGTAPRSDAGTDMVEPQRAPAPSYNYGPPPRPVVYGPRVAFGIGVGPGYGFYGPRFGFFRGPRFFHRRAFWRGRPHHWH